MAVHAGFVIADIADRIVPLDDGQELVLPLCEVPTQNPGPRIAGVQLVEPEADLRCTLCLDWTIHP